MCVSLALGLSLACGGGTAHGREGTEPVDHARSSLAGWPDAARARIEAVIAAHGRGTAGFDPARPPVAVFDWDNTSARGDVGDLAFAWMLDHDLVRWPGSLSDWGALTVAARSRLTEACSAPSAGATLATHEDGPCRSALAEVALAGTIDGAPAFETMIGPRYRASYGMLTRLFARMTDAQAQEIGEHAVERALAQPIGARRTIGGETIDDFLRLQEPVHTLFERLREEGFAVWIVSATFEPVVRAFAARAGFSADRVIGARLDEEGGVFVPRHPFEREHGPILTFDEGKRFWIRHAIFGMSAEDALGPIADEDPRPVLAGGDSDGDTAMLADASALSILFDRGAHRVTCLARAEPDRFVVLPQFVDPQEHPPVTCP